MVVVVGIVVVAAPPVDGTCGERRGEGRSACIRFRFKMVRVQDRVWLTCSSVRVRLELKLEL